MGRRERFISLEPKRRQALALFESGIGYKKAARLLDLSVYTVKDWSEQYKKGTFRPKLPYSVKGYPEDFKAKAVEMHKNGMTAFGTGT